MALQATQEPRASGCKVLSRQKLAGLGVGKSCLGASILIHVYFLQNTSNTFSSSFPCVTQKPYVTISFILSQEGTLSFPPSSAMEEEKIIWRIYLHQRQDMTSQKLFQFQTGS